MMLIFTVVGGLFLDVLFECFLKRTVRQTPDRRKTIEIGTVIAAVVAVGLAAGSLLYTQNVTDTLRDRIIALEKIAHGTPKAAP